MPDEVAPTLPGVPQLPLRLRLRDLRDMPGFNPSTQNGGRGDWSLRDVSAGNVIPDPAWPDKPRCVDHGAMNAVNPPRTIWRCLTCGRAAYRDA